MAKETIITPYEVEGEIDYQKLVEQFGASLITPALLGKIKNPPALLKNGFFYAHRDFDKLLEKGKFAIVSGRGPSENMTLGHLMIFRFIKELQERFGCYVFIPFSDDEKFLYKDMEFEDIQKFAIENAYDIAALGFDPKKTEFLIDTMHMNQELYNLAIKSAKKLTASTIKDLLGFGLDKNIGSFFYPAMQTAHILYPTLKYDLPVVVPIGIDQDPLLKLARDVAFKLRMEKPGGLLSKFMRGLDGSTKMSASKPESAVYLTDKPEDIRRKISNAFTGGQGNLADQKKLGGKPEVCTVFEYLKLFFLSENEIQKLEKGCRSGKLFCKDCKKLLADKLAKFLQEHQKKREQAKKLVDKYFVQNAFIRGKHKG